MIPPSNSSRSLSKGTMGLKFMNKVVPQIIKQEAASTPVDTHSATTSTPIKSAPTTTFNTPINTTPRSISTPRSIIHHEPSLLSFPLLSSTKTTTHSLPTVNYSIMVKTSTMVSGRRSFGGANIEIEHLENPPPPSVADPAGKTQHELATEKRNKKRPAVVEEAVEPAYRRDGVHSSNKKQRSDDGFRKPEGFDDVKRGGNSAGVLPKKVSRREEKRIAHQERSKAKGRSEVEPTWGKTGEERAWDAGKSVEQEGDSDQFDLEIEEDDEESEEDEETVRVAAQLLATATKKEKKDKKKKEKLLDEEMIDTAIEPAEREFGDEDADITVDVIKSKKGKKEKKQSKEKKEKKSKKSE